MRVGLRKSQSTCPECQQEAYAGQHDDACSKYNPDDMGIPVALRNQVLLPPLEPCEWCRLHTPPSEAWLHEGRKPVGLPCEFCGNDAPRGTYPVPTIYTGPEWGDREAPTLITNHRAPRAPQWRREVA